jgi:hypothetical protein
MRKFVLFAAAAALAIPAAAFADDATTPAPTPTPGPVQTCKQQRDAMGVDAFRALYGTNHNKRNAFGKCVSQQKRLREHATDAAKPSAVKACRTERAADPAAFAAKYGTNHNKRNAFGKCVSQHAKAAGAAAVADENAATIAAAKTCTDERNADPAAFAAKYGTNHNKRNAFGKCVSQHARSQHDQQGGDQGDHGRGHGHDGGETPPPTTTTTTTTTTSTTTTPPAPTPAS